MSGHKGVEGLAGEDKSRLLADLKARAKAKSGRDPSAPALHWEWKGSLCSSVMLRRLMK